MLCSVINWKFPVTYHTLLCLWGFLFRSFRTKPRFIWYTQNINCGWWWQSKQLLKWSTDSVYVTTVENSLKNADYNLNSAVSIEMLLMADLSAGWLIVAERYVSSKVPTIWFLKNKCNMILRQKTLISCIYIIFLIGFFHMLCAVLFVTFLSIQLVYL